MKGRYSPVLMGFLLVALLSASLAIADPMLGAYEGVSAKAGQGPDPVALDVFDRVTFYANGFVEFEWAVNEPGLGDGSYGRVIPRNAKEAALVFLMRNMETLGIPDINDLTVTGYDTGGDGAIQVIFEQSYLQRPILTSELRVHVLDREVIYVSGKIYPLVQNLDPGGIEPDSQHNLFPGTAPPGDDKAGDSIRLVYFPRGTDVVLGFEYSEEVADGDYVVIRDRNDDVLFSATTYRRP